MAKTRQKNDNLSRRQMARREKDAQQQRVLILIAAVVGIIIVAITVYGVITETAKSRRPVARIGEVMISTTDFKSRQYYERWMARLQVYSYQELLNQVQGDELIATPEDEVETPEDGVETPVDSANNAYIQQLQLNISSLESQLSEDLASLFASQVLDSMIEEELIRQEANTLGLTVNEQDVDLTIEEFMGFGTSSQTVTDTVATPDPQEIDDIFRQFETNVLEPSRFSEEDFRTMIKAGLLREQLQVVFSENVALEEDQVQITLIAHTSEDEANLLATRINDGDEEVETITAELNEDEDANSYAYSAPWLPIGYLGSQISVDLEQVAFNTPVGRASQPILGPDDLFFVIYVHGHEERPLSEEVLYQTQQQEYNYWLLNQTEESTEYLDWQDAVLTSP